MNSSVAGRGAEPNRGASHLHRDERWLTSPAPGVEPVTVFAGQPCPHRLLRRLTSPSGGAVGGRPLWERCSTEGISSRCATP
jgi:hypothetical protein